MTARIEFSSSAAIPSLVTFSLCKVLYFDEKQRLDMHAELNFRLRCNVCIADETQLIYSSDQK